jgi:intracellular multiplication protein IcmP
MQSRQQGGQDNSMDFLWGVALIIAGVLIVWFFGRSYITQFVYSFKLIEIDLIRYVITTYNTLAFKLHLPPIFANDLNAWQKLINNDQLGVDFQAFSSMLTGVGNYLRYPVCLLLLFLAVFVYAKNVTLKFKNIFDMKRMKVLEQKNWPQITPVVELNLVKADINQGPWAMSMTAMQFGKAHNLLKEKQGTDGRPTVELMRGNAHQTFVMQLGPVLADLNILPIHIKALLAIFAACANAKRKDADKLLHQIDISAKGGKLNFHGVQELLSKHYNNKVVTKALQKHAYVYTALASMLELARSDGVLASSEFLWLKPVDRKLWYMLNTVGRQTAVPEIAGAYSHWIAERKWGGPLRTPMVDEAVKALEVALSEVIYEPDEE